MIITKYFVYIHTSRTAGTFLNKLILSHVPDAQMLQYHGHLKDLPRAYSDLPVIGFVRNPWDWYVSMYFDYRRKRQYSYQVISEGGALDFEATVSRYLSLGDQSAQSNSLLEALVDIAPVEINAQTRPRLANPGLRSEHFASFPETDGYYSWLFHLMYESENTHSIHIGRFENLREEALRLFELTGTPITSAISTYLHDAGVLNPSPRRPRCFVEGYPPQLEQLVAEKEKYVIDRFGYDFSMPTKWANYPKTDFFNRLGTANISALVERVRKIPESEWQQGDEDKPNKLNNLNDTSHIMFRYIAGFDKVFDSQDYPMWDDWKDLLLPIMNQAAQSLGYTDYRFPRVMLAKLPAGGVISQHTDRMASYFIHKIHVPLITNSQTTFHVGAQSRNLTAGEIVEVNNKRTHAVENKGEQNRVHLVFECYNSNDYGKLA